MAKHVQLDFDAYDCTTELWDKFEEDLFGHCAGQIDKSGSTVLDALLDRDMGGGAPGALGMPATPVGVGRAAVPQGTLVAHANDLREMTRLRTTRNTLGYSIIIKHISNPTYKSLLAKAPYP